MTYYDEQLQELQARCDRKKHLDAQVRELQTQQRELSSQVRQLEAIKLDEQEDIDRLERGSLAAFFYNVIGKMDEKLTKERQEAYAARVKYDAAAAELAKVKQELDKAWTELRRLQGCEAELDALLEEKAEALKARGGPAAAEILQLEQQQAHLQHRKKELDEALSAGRSAMDTTEQVLSSLDSAEGWGTWDMLGGGLLADMAKHGHLDDAQASVSLLQSQLRRFKTELADVTVDADLQVSLDGFMRFSDYFFDGLFMDWMVQDKIHQSQEQVRQTKIKLWESISRLEQLLKHTDQQLSGTEQQLEELILRTELT